MRSEPRPVISNANEPNQALRHPPCLQISLPHFFLFFSHQLPVAEPSRLCLITQISLLRDPELPLEILTVTAFVHPLGHICRRTTRPTEPFAIRWSHLFPLPTKRPPKTSSKRLFMYSPYVNIFDHHLPLKLHLFRDLRKPFSIQSRSCG